jgi:hypothetical protein
LFEGLITVDPINCPMAFLVFSSNALPGRLRIALLAAGLLKDCSWGLRLGLVAPPCGLAAGLRGLVA